MVDSDVQLVPLLLTFRSRRQTSDACSCPSLFCDAAWRRHFKSWCNGLQLPYTASTAKVRIFRTTVSQQQSQFQHRKPLPRHCFVTYTTLPPEPPNSTTTSHTNNKQTTINNVKVIGHREVRRGFLFCK